MEKFACRNSTFSKKNLSRTSPSGFISRRSFRNFYTFGDKKIRGSGGCSKNPVTEKPGKREGKRGWMDGWYRQWFLDSAIELADSFFQFALMPWNRAGKNESNRLYK